MVIEVDSLKQVLPHSLSRLFGKKYAVITLAIIAAATIMLTVQPLLRTKEKEEPKTTFSSVYAKINEQGDIEKEERKIDYLLSLKRESEEKSAKNAAAVEAAARDENDRIIAENARIAAELEAERLRQIDYENQLLQAARDKYQTTVLDYGVLIASRGAESGPKYYLDDYSIEMLERIVMAEAGFEPFEGQLAVANIVLNRLDSPLFPKTVTEVLFQPGQFMAQDDYRYYRYQPTESVKSAVKAAIYGDTVLDPGVFFYISVSAMSNPYNYGRSFSKQIANHYFYY